MAAMKLTLSLTSGFIALTPAPFGAFWLLLYLPGLIAGTAGTMSIAKSDFTHPIRIITAALEAPLSLVGPSPWLSDTTLQATILESL